MYQEWAIEGKKGNIVSPKGEVVYQTKGVVIEPIYQTEDGKRYILDLEENIVEIDGEQYIKLDGRKFIEDNGQKYAAVTSGRLLEVTTNPFNGYCYRQDGK